MNENRLILYNRFVVRGGPGILGTTCSFDHIIRRNAIAVENEMQSAIRLASNDCIGVEVVENRVFGAGGKLVSGEAKPDRVTDNSVALSTDSPPRPDPKVSSIFEWQRGMAAK